MLALLLVKILVFGHQRYMAKRVKAAFMVRAEVTSRKHACEVGMQPGLSPATATADVF